MLDGARRQGQAESHGAAGALRRSARRRALRRSPTTWPACPAPTRPSCSTTTRPRARTPTTSSTRCSIWTAMKSSRCPQVSVHSCHLQGGVDPEGWQILGAKPEALQASQRQRARGQLQGHRDPQDLHALSGRQCARQGRALRLDGVLGDRLLQFGAGRAHQHRRAREHQRRDAHRQDSRLGPASRGEPLRHASDRGRGRGREPDGLGHARVFHRRRGGGTHSGSHRPLRHAAISSVTSTSAPPPPPPAASSCITSSA